MIFNIVVDLVAMLVLEEVYGPQDAFHGMGWVEG